MAVNFGLLQQAAPVSAFFQGRQDVQAEADRNVLRQQQAEQLAMQRENALALREQRAASAAELKAKTERAAQRQQFLTNLSAKMAEGGHKLDRPTLGQVLQFGMQTGEDSLIKLATEGLRALDEEDVYRSEAARLGQPGAEGYTRPQVQQMIASPSTRLQAQGKALAPTLPPVAKPTPAETEEIVTRLQDPSLTPQQRAALEARLRILTTREPKQPREPAAPTIAQIQDPTNPDQMLTVDARRYAGGGVGSPGVIGTSGKTPKAAADRLKQEQGASQAQDILDTLRAAYGELDRMRAIPSEQRTAISNVLSGIAATGVGQTAGRMAGTAAQTQRDIIASARNQLLMSVARATGLSASQLNSNVEFRTWLDSLTDTSKSIQANQAILENVERFIASGGKYSARKSEGQVTPAAPAPAAPAPAGGNFPAPPPAAIDALKRGQGTDAQFDAIFGPGAAARARGR